MSFTGEVPRGGVRLGEELEPGATGSLSFQQEEQVRRLFQHPECATTYDMARLYRLGDDVDLDCLVRSITDLVRRHQVLSITVEEGDSGLLQRIHPAEEREPAILRWESGTTEEQVGETVLASRYGGEEVCSGWPLFRPQIHMVGSGRFLSLNLHHLLYDGWSLDVLWRDLFLLYQTRVSGAPADLPRLSASYLDFSRWQREAWAELSGRAVPFWREQLDGYHGQGEWPQPVGGHAGDAYRAVSVSTDLSTRHLAVVRTLGTQERVTAFMVLLSATMAAMAAMTGRPDVVVGTDYANREAGYKAAMIGFFVNTRLTRVTVDTGTTLPEVVRQVRRSWLAAEPFRDAYIDPLLQELGRPDWIKVGVAAFPSLAGRAAAAPEIPLSITPVPLELQHRYWRDLTVDWTVRGQGAVLRLVYRPSRVDGTAVRNLAAHVLRALEAC